MAWTLLTSMRPLMRWRPPVLEVDYGTELPPTLVYPIDQEFRWCHATQPASGCSLDAPLGNTRGAVLRTVDHGATTAQTARRLDTAVSSVSRHAAVLRDAGLITSHRHEKAVLHALTPLGAALLENERV